MKMSEDAASTIPNSRIDEVEKDVKKLKTDLENFTSLQDTVEELKNTIVDIRSFISEAQSPFNLLQLVTNEDDLNKVVQAKPIIEKKLLAQTRKDKAEAQTEGKGSVPAVGDAEKPGFLVETCIRSKSTDLPEVTDPEKTSTEKVPPENPIENQNKEVVDVVENPLEGLGSMNRGSSIVSWVYTMLDLGFDEESIRKICDYCEFSEFMPKGYSMQVSNLVGAIVKARSQKLSAEEVILSLYGAAEAAGTKINPENLTTLIMHVLKQTKTGEH